MFEGLEIVEGDFVIAKVLDVVLLTFGFRN